MGVELNRKLLVTVMSNTSIKAEREDWVQLALKSLARAYDDDEPDYPRDIIKEANPEYDGSTRGGI